MLSHFFNDQIHSWVTSTTTSAKKHDYEYALDWACFWFTLLGNIRNLDETVGLFNNMSGFFNNLEGIFWHRKICFHCASVRQNIIPRTPLWLVQLGRRNRTRHWNKLSDKPTQRSYTSNWGNAWWLWNDMLHMSLNRQGDQMCEVYTSPADRRKLNSKFEYCMNLGPILACSVGHLMYKLPL